MASVSPLGGNEKEVWSNYKKDSHFISSARFNNAETFAAFLPEQLKTEIYELRKSNPSYRQLDDSVLYAIYASRKAVNKAGWPQGTDLGVNIGSSRGATGLFEKFHKSYLESGIAEILASPTTTLGNISSWIAQDLESPGPEISHSVTCSTGLHAVLNAVAWLQAGMAEKFLVGGSEAPLTGFTIAQMKAMKIYALENRDYPCQALNMEKSANSMVLGEAAAVLCLDTEKENSIGRIKGIGYATEQLKHPVSISANAECFQKSMRMAIKETGAGEVDAVVMHAPGTIKGDQAELQAVKAVFKRDIPGLTSNKWKTGHSFGTSGLLSMELALLMLQHQEFIAVPFSDTSKAPARLKNILVNAVGFGGNAISVLLSRD